MTKQELIKYIAEDTGITQAQAAQALVSLESAAFTTLKKSGEFALPSFGIFKVVKTKARTGRNPSTGEAIQIKAGKKVKLKVAKALKDAVT